MKLLKREKDALASLLEAGAESPEALVEDFVKLLDELRGQRTYRYAVLRVAGVPIVVGPYATDKQARSAVEKAGIADTVIWVEHGWTEEGFKAHMAAVDEKPAPYELNATEQRKRDAQFWSKARPLMDGEANGLVVKDRGPAISLVKKGHW